MVTPSARRACGEFLAHVDVFPGKDLGQHLDEGDFGPQPAEDLAPLAAHGPGPHHHDARGHGGQSQGTVGVEHSGRVDPGDRQRQAASTR